MKEQDLREKFEDCVIMNYVGINADKCVQIAIDYAREEVLGFSEWKDKNTLPASCANLFYLNPESELLFKNYIYKYTYSELYEIYLTNKTK